MKSEQGFLNPEVLPQEETENKKKLNTETAMSEVAGEDDSSHGSLHTERLASEKNDEEKLAKVREGINLEKNGEKCKSAITDLRNAGNVFESASHVAEKLSQMKTGMFANSVHEESFLKTKQELLDTIKKGYDTFYGYSESRAGRFGFDGVTGIAQELSAATKPGDVKAIAEKLVFELRSTGGMLKITADSMDAKIKG